MKTVPVRSFLAGALCGIVLTTITTFGADYQSTVMADSPAGYWRLGDMPLTYDDPIKITTNSGSLGDAGTGTLIGYVRRNQSGALAGSTDTAYRFWAGDGRVSITNSAPFNFTGTTAFTLEVWAKPTIPPSGSQRLLSNGSAGQGYGFTLQGNNLLRLTAFGVVDRNSDAVATPWDTNQWYHFVLVRSNTAVFFYVNGALLGTPKIVSAINTTANPLALGARADGAESFTGLLDEPAVYANVLAVDRIAAHYSTGTNNGSGYAAVVLADGPIGYWHLNEPPKTESPSIIANSGAVGTSADGRVFGSLNSVTGGLTGAPLGDLNTAMAFAGQNGKIDVPQNAGLNASNFTVECWANLGIWANSHQSPVSSRNSGFGGTLGYILYAAPLSTAANAPRWEFWTGPGWDVVSGVNADVVMNQWTHLVGTYDAATGSKLLYVNGQLMSGKVNVLLAPNNLSPLRIGAGATENPGGSFFWNGGLDEVAVYPSVLPPGRVLSHYQAAMGTSPITVVAPAAVVNPAGQTNWAPYPVTLSAVMSGTLPMQFQWYRVSPDGLTTNAVPNGTNLVLRLDPTSPALDGNYFVSASNSVGYAESAWAWVEITPLTLPTFVLNAPASVPVYAGGTAGIPLVVTGTPPMNFQWQSNTLAIAGGTNAILALANVQNSFSAATFQATVSNPAGASTSDPAHLSVLTPTASSYAAQATTLNPLAYWRLGEASGTLAFDYWGAHPAVYVNTQQQGSTPGALLEDDDGAVTLQGAGSYLRSLEAAPFSFSGFQNFTLSSFVKVTTAPAANTPARIFSNWQGATATNLSSGFGFGLYGMTKLRFTAFGIVDLDANVSALSTDTWYHLAAVRSNNWVYLYINGVLANSGAVGAVRASAFPLQLGGNPNAGTTESFTGLLDEAAVFGRALSATEITSLYNARYGSLLPPNIVQQPSPSKVFSGGTARFNVQAIGSTPIGYLWKANNIAIPDATNSSLVVTGLTLANNGTTYTVTITNRAGTLTSVPALLSVTQPSGYSAAVVADRPVSLYRLGEASGPLVYDAWGGFNGQDNGAVAFGAPGALLGDADTAATFDGTSSRIDIPYTPDLNPPVFSIEAWAKVTGGQGTYRAVISARDEGTGFEKGFIIYAAAGNVWTFWVGDGAVWQGLNGPAIALNEWTHLAAVYDGQTKSFYVNGNLVGTQTVGYVPNNLRSLRIGAGRNEFDTPPASDPTLYYFNGSIDEVAVYRTVLSAQRVAYHYALGYYGNNTAPLMVQEPISQTVSVGTPVTLQAQAGGSPTLMYQWLKDGQPLAGATTPSLTASAAGYADNGVYVLSVTNSVGYTNSAAARLTVLPPPTFALLTNDLVLHLRFDGNCDDSSGRFNNGIPYGAVTFVPGRVGANALHYYTDKAASSYNYVYLGQVPDLLFGTDASFSFSYWVRFTGSPGDLPFITSAVQSFSNPGFTFAPSYLRGGWSWSLGDGTGYIGVNGADNSINDGNWHHLAHLFDRTNGVAITCLDGVPVNSRALPFGRGFDTSDNVMVGQDPTGLYGENGSADIDDIGVWRRALTTYEAQSIYAAGARGASFDVTAPIHLAVQISGADVLLLWQAGTLQQSDTPGGTYSPVQGAQAPSYKLTPGIGKKFYRVQP